MSAGGWRDSLIAELRAMNAEARATIATLEARVEELKKLVKHYQDREVDYSFRNTPSGSGDR